MEEQQQSFGEWLMQPTESIKMKEDSDAPNRAQDFNSPGTWGSPDGRELVLVYIPSTHTIHRILAENWNVPMKRVVRHFKGYPIEPKPFSEHLKPEYVGIGPADKDRKKDLSPG